MKTKLIRMSLAAAIAAAGISSAFAQNLNYDDSNAWIQQSLKNSSQSATVDTSPLSVSNIDVSKTIALNDGSAVHVFKDGKMGMEDNLGRPLSMAPGHIMQTKDGSKITMQGNEIARVSGLRPEYQ